MTIVSLAFIVFVLLTTIIYFIIPQKWQWVVLLIASYVFFFANSKWLALILLATSLCTFFMASWMHSISIKGKLELEKQGSALSPQEKRTSKLKTKHKMKQILILSICIDLGVLLFLKYFNFFSESLNIILPNGLEIPQVNFLLPIGISFYTLQAIAYLVDIYREKYTPDTNPFKFLLFMSFFPQIIQGPIARHNQLAHQLYEGHRFDSDRCVKGIELMAWGWFKKMVIADRMATPVNAIFGNASEYTGIMIFMAAIGYGFQVYTDFSGGMDVVRGVSQIFGINLELNFRQPYFSRSIEEFWRRWHITLGGWMRDYVFYPLSLSKAFGRMGKAAMKTLGKYIGKRLPAFLAMFIVYFLVGFWHGPDFKYIVYGVWNGIFIVAGILLEDTYRKCRSILHIRDDSKIWFAFQIIRTFCICSIGRIFSRADSLRTAMYMLLKMFTGIADPTSVNKSVIVSLGLNMANWGVLIAAIILLLAVDYLHENGIGIRNMISKQHLVIRWIIYYCAIIILLVFGIYGPGYDSASFIYEQF